MPLKLELVVLFLFNPNPVVLKDRFLIVMFYENNEDVYDFFSGFLDRFLSKISSSR